MGHHTWPHTTSLSLFLQVPSEPLKCELMVKPEFGEGVDVNNPHETLSVDRDQLSAAQKADPISYFMIYIYIYIYAFSRHFYPKRLALHSSYSFTFDQLLLFLGIEPMILALLAPCSTS